MIKVFFRHLNAVSAALASFFTLLTVCFRLDCIKSSFLYGAIVIGIIILLCVSYAVWQIRSKKKIVLNFSTNLKLTIVEGDIFNKNNIICIPVNEYFDTHVGDGVISEKTLHGIFINKFYRDRVKELEAKIRTGLDGEEFEEHSRRLKCCPTRKFNLGTCVDIRDGENTYVLFALTHFDDNDKAHVSRAEYSHVVCELMKHLASIAEDKPVFMPLFGTGLSRIQRTPQRILYQLVSILDFDDTNVFKGGVNIIIKSLKENDINLTILEEVIKEGITK